jgi:hypothetical protein
MLHFIVPQVLQAFGTEYQFVISGIGIQSQNSRRKMGRIDINHYDSPKTLGFSTPCGSR